MVLARADQAVSGGPPDPQDEVVFERLLSVERNEFGLGNGNGGYRRISPFAAHSGDRLLSEPQLALSLGAITALDAPQPILLRWKGAP